MFETKDLGLTPYTGYKNMKFLFSQLGLLESDHKQGDLISGETL